MLFEDAHWIDPTSLELLTLTVARASTLPLLLLVTARPEFIPPWPADAHVTMQALARLGRREGMTLVERSAGGKALPAEILEQILARTDGVPLFLEELTKTIIESGLLREEDGHYALDGALPPRAIPTTLHELADGSARSPGAGTRGRPDRRRHRPRVLLSVAQRRRPAAR